MGIETIGNVIFKSADDSQVVFVYRQRENDRRDLGTIDRRDNFLPGQAELTIEEERAVSDYLVRRAYAKES